MGKDKIANHYNRLVEEFGKISPYLNSSNPDNDGLISRINEFREGFAYLDYLVRKEGTKTNYESEKEGTKTNYESERNLRFRKVTEETRGLILKIRGIENKNQGKLIAKQLLVIIGLFYEEAFKDGIEYKKKYLPNENRPPGFKV